MTRNETPPDKGGSGQWLKSNLSALGSATVFAVYAAGFVKTKAAAESFSDQPVRRAGTISVAPPADTMAASAVVPQPVNQPVRAPTTQTGAIPAQTPADVPAQTSVQAAAPAARAAAPKQSAAPAANAPATSHDSARASVVAPSSVQAATVVASAPPPAATPVAAAVVPSPAPAPAVQTPTPAPTPAPVAATPAPTPPAPATPVPAAQDAAPSKRVGFKDGTFVGYGRSRHGDIEATVDIIEGRIADAYITSCRTEYSCSWIVNLPPEVVKRQSAEVDIVSGATASSDAFYAAIVAALNKAK